MLLLREFLMPTLPDIRDDGLQLTEAPRFQSRFWIAERIMWGVFAIIVVGSLLGFSGSGGAFSTTIAAVDSGTVEAPQVARWQTSDQITVTFNGTAETHRLEFDPRFLENFSVEQIQPQPTSSSQKEGGVLFAFKSNGAGTNRAVLDIRPTGPGIARLQGKLDGDAFDLTTIILP